MSVTGPGVSSGAIDPTTPDLTTADAAAASTAASPSSAAATRGGGSTGRMRVMAESLRPPSAAAASSGVAVAHEIPGASAAILEDGSIVPTDPGIPGGPLAALTRAGARGRPPFRITIPAPSSTPSLFERMNDPETDAIFYLGHAGYGHRADYALAHGVEGSGDGKLVALFQCWGLGNAESIERIYPDAQFLSTVPTTHDGLDWLMLESMFRGFERKEGWDTIHHRATRWMKEAYGTDPEYKDKDWDAHFFTPTARSVLVEKYDRDGDGVPDQGDHIFNVVYPKRRGAAGGYDPVAQAIPPYALDGTELSAAVGAMSLVVRYDHPLEPALEAKLPWKPELWKPGGFFQPAADDLRAFRFTRSPDGKVKVALSTRFAHTQKEDLSRMLAYEAGLWLGGEAQLEPTRRAALGLALVQRVVHQQSDWFSADSLLDQPGAEEQLFAARYGIEGVTFSQLDRAVGEVDDYGPAQLRSVEAAVADAPGLAGLANRAPTRVGAPIAVPDVVRRAQLQRPSTQTLRDLLQTLGVQGEVTGFSPPYMPMSRPANLVVYVRDGAKTFQVSLAVDDNRRIHTASRLDLNTDQLAKQALLRDLTTIAESGKGLDPQAMLAAYDAERESGKPFADAMAAVLTQSRPHLPLGFEMPRLESLDSLTELGIVSRADFERLRRQVGGIFPGRAEGELLRALSALAPALDLEAVYRQSLGDDTEPAARLRAVRAVMDALPPGTRVAAGDWPKLAQALSSPLFVPPDEVAPTARALATALGLDRGDLVSASVSQIVSDASSRRRPGGGGARPTVDAAAVQAAEDAARRAVQAGASVSDATVAGIEAFIRAAGDVTLRLSIGPLLAQGLLSLGSAETNALSDRFSNLTRRTRTESALLREIAAASGDGFVDVRARFDAAAERLGSRAAAAGELARATSGLRPTGEWFEAALAIAPPTERVDLVDQLLAAMGSSRAAEVRRRLVDALSSSPAGVRSDVAVRAFDAAIASGASVDAAVVAMLRSTAPAALSLYTVPQALESLLSPAAQVYLRDAARTAETETRPAAWIEADGGDAAAAVGAHADRLESGTPYADSFLDLLRAAPDASVRGSFDWLDVILGDVLEVLLPLPRAARPGALELLLSKVGKDLPTVLWAAIKSEARGLDGQARAAETALREAMGRGASLEGALRATAEAFGPDGPRLPNRVLDDLERGGLLPRAARDALARDFVTGHPGFGREASRVAAALVEEPAAAEALATAIVGEAQSAGPAAALAQLASGLAGRTIERGATSFFGGALGPVRTWLRAVPEGERGAATERLLTAMGLTRDDLVIALAEQHFNPYVTNRGVGSDGDFRPALRAALASGTAVSAFVEVNQRFGMFGAFDRGRLAGALQTFGLATEAEAAALLEPPVVA